MIDMRLERLAKSSLKLAAEAISSPAFSLVLLIGRKNTHLQYTACRTTIFPRASLHFTHLSDLSNLDFSALLGAGSCMWCGVRTRHERICLYIWVSTCFNHRSRDDMADNNLVCTSVCVSLDECLKQTLKAAARGRILIACLNADLGVFGPMCCRPLRRHSSRHTMDIRLSVPVHGERLAFPRHGI